MRSCIAFIILFFFTTITFGQIQYDKGYVITKENKRLDCLIKNLYWEENPVNFQYKLKKSDKPIEGNLTTIKEFGIDNNCRYVNGNVAADLSNKPTMGVRDKLTIVLTKQNLFLKVLLDGKATLYGYKKDKVERFFYSTNDSVIHFLTFKQIHERNTLIKNTDFRQQLWDRLRIPKTTYETLKTVAYTEHDLKEYFKSYNGNFEEPITEIITPKKMKIFNLKLTPGVNLSSADLTVIEREGQPELTFDSKPGIRLGVEAELALPFDKYRWGILVEPNFNAYSSEADNGQEKASISYKSVEFPIGLRYYVYINDDSRFYVNGFYIASAALNLNSKIEYQSFTQNDRVREIEPASNMAFGAGLDYKKFSIEARYHTKRDILSSYSFDFSDYNRFSIILGYRFLNKKF